MFRGAGKERGGVLVEYVVGLVALLAALLAPVFNGKSAIDLLEDAMKKEYSGYAYAINKPRLPESFSSK